MTATLRGEEQSELDYVEFKIVDGKRRLPVKTTPLGNGRYLLEINVTNFRNRRQIPNGTWRFVPYINGIRDEAARFDLADLTTLDQDSRTFLYARNRAAYIVNFGIAESEESPDFLMRTYQMGRAATPSKTKPTLKRRLRQWLLSEERRMKLANAVYRLSRKVNAGRGNRIMFASEMRTQMEGNLLRVHERMVERGLDSQFNFRYSFRVPRVATRLSSLRMIYLLATSDFVLVDDYFEMLAKVKLSPRTKVIQLWHAGSGFKSIGYSRFGTYGSPKLRNAHRMYTYAITGSKDLVPVYAEAFGIEESAVIPTGLPRIDTFLDAERTEQVVSDFYQRYPNLAGKRIILFAPTFRGRGVNDARYDYAQIDFDELYEMCGDHSVVIFRMHHFIPGAVPISPEYADRLIDGVGLPQTNDLLHVTDVLITDYSSVIYEYSLLNKPMLFFAYDKLTYSAVRGFHRDYDVTAPGKVCENFDDLLKALETEDYDTWKIAEFRRHNFDRIDTGAADRVIDWLILGQPHMEHQLQLQMVIEEPVSTVDVTLDALAGDTALDALTADTALLPLAGDTALAPLAGETTLVPLCGDTTPVPLAGETTLVPLCGDTTPVPLAGDTTPVPLAGDAALVPLAGDTTPDSLAGVAPR